MSPSNAYPRRRMSWNVGRPPRSLALLRTSLAGRCRSPSPRPATLPPDAIEEVRETGVGRHVTELAPMSSAEALRGSAGARASPACPAGRADRCVHPLFRRRTRKAANSHKAPLSAVAEGPMKLTTGWSGDSAQDLSRGRLPVPCQRKCQGRRVSVRSDLGTVTFLAHFGPCRAVERDSKSAAFRQATGG